MPARRRLAMATCDSPRWPAIFLLRFAAWQDYNPGTGSSSAAEAAKRGSHRAIRLKRRRAFRHFSIAPEIRRGSNPQLSLPGPAILKS
jgi:hypothetical protein